MRIRGITPPNENTHVQDYSDGIKHLAVNLDRLNTRP
jgi:hypothetical protein